MKLKAPGFNRCSERGLEENSVSLVFNALSFDSLY